MPELPEVETIRRGLLPVVIGKELREMRVRRRDLRWPVPHDIEMRCIAAQTHSLDRRGKYLLWRFSNGWVQLLHLGMSGRILIVDPETPVGPHDHIDWIMEDRRCIRFNDPRRFGSLDVMRDNSVHCHPRLAQMGPEPDALTPGRLFEWLSRKRGRLATQLLDQRLVAGLGNIYVNETCFKAGLSPLIEARQVRLDECEKLVAMGQHVLHDAITAGGSSLRDYVQTDGSLGYFAAQWKVYGREGEPCMICSTAIERAALSGRSVFFCPTCQRA